MELFPYDDPEINALFERHRQLIAEADRVKFEICTRAAMAGPPAKRRRRRRQAAFTPSTSQTPAMDEATSSTTVLQTPINLDPRYAPYKIYQWLCAQPNGTKRRIDLIAGLPDINPGTIGSAVNTLKKDGHITQNGRDTPYIVVGR